MGGKISELSDATINQIAAGEVIENPASVVKELVENALDAGASSISVEVQGSGFLLIRISDDGVGMSRRDVKMSVRRHATSKISVVEDLDSLTSMGFRGEALASIASIAKLSIISCDGSETTQFDVYDKELKAGSRVRGTTIEVRSLFYNVPARMKFQKSPKTSKNHITKCVTKLALANHDKSFTLSFDGAVKIDVVPESRKQRVIHLLGKEFVEYESSMGFFGHPKSVKSNRSSQYLFINGRSVSCLPISYAVNDGYGTRLAVQSHPIFVLFLEISPSQIDVNVHPQKLEVRFIDEQKVRSLVVRNVAKSFITKAPVAKPIFDSPMPVWNKESFVAPEPIWEETLLPVEGRAAPISLSGRFLFVDGEALKINSEWTGVVIIDLNAAYSRVGYQEMMSGKSEPLLVPHTIEVSEVDEQRLEVLKELGIEIRQFGEKTVIIDALPQKVSIDDVEKALFGKGHKEQLARRLASESKRGYSVVEAMALVEELLRCDEPLLSPTGRPTMKHLSQSELGGLFEKAHAPI